MVREPIPTWCFAVVVVRHGDRFLIVHEHKHGQLWYLPAGRVNPGETFVAAACRETLEESGVRVQVVGVLRVEHSPSLSGTRLRVVFLAEPVGDITPKSLPDEESLGAAWVKLEELAEYPLRGQEVKELFAYVAVGGAVYPVDVLQPEGMPFWIRPNEHAYGSYKLTVETLTALWLLTQGSLNVYEPVVLSTYVWNGAENDPVEQQLWLKYRDSVDQVRRAWGEPEYEGEGPRAGYQGSLTADMVSNWSSALRIAWWPRDGHTAAVMVTGHDANTLLILQLALGKRG